MIYAGSLLGLINGLTDSPERIEPLPALALVVEVSDRLFDRFVTASR